MAKGEVFITKELLCFPNGYQGWGRGKGVKGILYLAPTRTMVGDLKDLVAPPF